MRRAILTAIAIGLAAPAAAQPVALPVHGNWCGPGWGGGMPLDALDAACMRHDFCTAQQGYFDCGCDLGFMDELRATPWPNPGMSEKARAVFDAIAMVPCRDPAGQARKTAWAFAAWADGVTAGREAPWAVLDRFARLLGASR